MLSTEIEIKNILCNTKKELPVTLKIRFKAKFDKSITEKKKERDHELAKENVKSRKHLFARIKSHMRSYIYWPGMKSKTS